MTTRKQKKAEYCERFCVGTDAGIFHEENCALKDFDVDLDFENLFKENVDGNVDESVKDCECPFHSGVYEWSKSLQIVIDADILVGLTVMSEAVLLALAAEQAAGRKLPKFSDDMIVTGTKAHVLLEQIIETHEKFKQWRLSNPPYGGRLN